jgi:uncharacterized RDD family membrane protein YckC
VPFPTVTPTAPPAPTAPIGQPGQSPVDARMPASAPTPGSVAPDDDLQDLLDRLHDDLDLGEQTPVVAVGSATTKPIDATRPPMASDVVIEAGDGIAFQPSFASFGARLLGLVIDVGVLTVFCLPGIAAIAFGSGGLMIVFGAILMFAGFCAATVVYAKGVSRSGQSIGNKATRTRVVDARNGHLVPAGEAGTRYVVRMLISMILFIGFLMALGNSQRRTFHDNIAGTVVIRPARASWSIDDEMEP